MHNWQKKNTPWLCHYEEVIRNNSFVTFECQDVYMPSSPHYNQPHAPVVEYQHDQQREDQQNDLRTYDPYLISYHEDTNTFTYNDPWVEVKHEDISSNNYNNENHHDPMPSQPLPEESSSNGYYNAHQADDINNNNYNNNDDNNCDKIITEISPPAAIIVEQTKVIEHVLEEVSYLSLALSLPLIFFAAK